jgi:hypothetical protein
MLSTLSVIAIGISVVLTQPVLQASKKSNDPAWNEFYAKQKKIREKGQAALLQMRTHDNPDLCLDAAQKNGNAGMGECLGAQVKITETNYLDYIRSIGALLRLTAPGSKNAEGTRDAKPLSFDAAESAWQTYRDRGCASMSTQWEGGDQAPIAYSSCLIKLTQKHVNELADLYGDLYH